jgi:PQQ-dependent catabolism-associated CXXCW motif protein
MSTGTCIKFAKITLVTLGLCLASAVVGWAGEPDAQPPVNEKGKEAYAKFLSAEPAKAFAVSPAGGWGVAFKRENRMKAASVALYACNKASQNICRIYAVNDDTVYPRYAAFEQGSKALFEKFRNETLRAANYGDEQRDYGVAPLSGLRASPYHSETPLLLNGVRTIGTVELVKAMTSGAPAILVDVLEGDGHKTIPGAYWVKGAGLAGGEELNAEIRDRLGFVLAGLTAKDKAAPLAFFCLDSMCWLSYNAAMRARDLGYSNVFWHRGGTKAWESAHLPVIDAVQYGQVR